MKKKMIISLQLYAQHVEFAFACHLVINIASHKGGILSSRKAVICLHGNGCTGLLFPPE